MKKNILYAIIALIIAIVFLVPSVREKLQELFLPIAKVQEAVRISADDYNISLKGINTPNANLADFKDEMLFLNFWGTWCPPCRQEWGSIQKLYEAKKDKLNFVLIAMQDEEPAVRKFLEENKYTAPVYIAESPISDKLLPKSFPTTFIISNRGQILKKETGALDWNSSNIHQFIDNLSR